MEEIPFLQWITGVGGIGAAFGLLMYFVLRANMQTMEKDRKASEEKLADLVKEYHTTCLVTQNVIVEHTKITTELYTYLKAKNGVHH